MKPLPKNRPESCLSDLRLDLLLGGTLGAGARAAVKSHLDSCEHCSDRLVVLESSRTEIRAALPPPAFLRKAAPAQPSGLSALTESFRSLSWGPRLGFGFALASLALVLVVGKVGLPPLEPEANRLKGSSHIGFFVKHGESVRLGQSGEAAFPGDALRFTYATPRTGFLAILSIDGAHKASVYFSEGDRAAGITPGTNVALPSSVVLDDVLGVETIYGLFCASPVELEPIRIALETGPDLLPGATDCEVDRLTLAKRPLP